MTNNVEQKLENNVEEAKQNLDTIDLYDEFTSFKPIELVRYFDNRTSPVTIREELLLECTTKGTNAKTYILKLKSTDLKTLKDFRDALSETIANLNISFKEKEFACIRQKWFNDVPTKDKFLCAGYQNNIFVGHNFIFDYNSETPFYLNKAIPNDGSDSALYSLISQPNSCVPKIYASTTSGKIFEEFFDSFLSCFKSPITQLCFGASLATLYWDIFHMNTQGFPSIFLTGESHAGKTTLLQIISAIFGLQDVSNDATGGNSTVYAIGYNLSTRFNIPVFIEELPASIFENLEPLVKNAYSGIARHRGKKDTLEKMRIFTSFITTSNHFFTKTPVQLLSRILFANMKKEECNFENFPYFDANKRRELSVLLITFLNARKNVFPLYTQTYARVKELIPKVESRHLSNVAIGCTMWEIINNLLGKNVADWQKMALEYQEMYENCLNAEVSEGDAFISNIAKLLDENILVYGSDYKLVEKCLKINLNRYITKHNIHNPKNLLSAKQFRLAVENDKRFDCKTVPVKGINRAISIDISDEEYLLEILVRVRHHWSIYNKKTDEE